MAAEGAGESERVSEERAAEVFRRAARLQSAAAERMQQERARDASSALAPVPRELGPEELEAIGREVGIEPAFIRMALAETATAPAGGFVRWGARWLLRVPADALLLATRTVSASAGEVLAAMRRLLPGEPHRLLLVDTVGDPLRGGSLLFQLPAWSPGMSPLTYYASGIQARRLTFTLKELPSGDSAATPARTEIQVYAHPGPGVRTGVAVATILAGCLGTAGGISAAVLSAIALGPFSLAAGAAGLVAGGLLGGRGYGVIHRHSHRRFGEELDALLGAIAADLATGGSFSPGAAEAALPVRSDAWSGS